MRGCRGNRDHGGGDGQGKRTQNQDKAISNLSIWSNKTLRAVFRRAEGFCRLSVKFEASNLNSDLYGVISGEKFDAAKERQLAGWERSRYTSFSRNMKVNLEHTEVEKVIYHYYCGIFYVEQ